MEEENKTNEEKYYEECNLDAGEHLKNMILGSHFSMTDVYRKYGMSKTNFDRIINGVQGLNVKKLRFLGENFGFSANEIIWGPECEELLRSFKRRAGRKVEDEEPYDYFASTLKELCIEIRNISDPAQQMRIMNMYLYNFFELLKKNMDIR